MFDLFYFGSHDCGIGGMVPHGTGSFLHEGPGNRPYDRKFLYSNNAIRLRCEL